jgi:hypothetical protein
MLVETSVANTYPRWSDASRRQERLVAGACCDVKNSIAGNEIGKIEHCLVRSGVDLIPKGFPPLPLFGNIA